MIMKILAPEIFRQRLLIEGFYKRNVNEKVIETFFKNITKKLKLKIYSKPIIFSPAGTGKKENQGYDAFVPLIDSGISVYVWSNAKFLSAVLYTCKGFDEKGAIDFTKKFFKIEIIQSKSF